MAIIRPALTRSIIRDGLIRADLFSRHFGAGGGGGAGAGARQLIETQVISDDATIEFITGITSTYNTYEFVLAGVTPASDGVDFNLSISDDGGVSWEAGATDYSYASGSVYSSGSTGVDATNGNTETSGVPVTAGLVNGAAAGENMSGTIRMYEPASASLYCLFQTQLALMETTANRIRVMSGMGSSNAAAAVNGVRFNFSTGNIAAGRITLYGIKHT